MHKVNARRRLAPLLGQREVDANLEALDFGPVHGLAGGRGRLHRVEVDETKATRPSVGPVHNQLDLFNRAVVTKLLLQPLLGRLEVEAEDAEAVGRLGLVPCLVLFPRRQVRARRATAAAAIAAVVAPGRS